MKRFNIEKDGIEFKNLISGPAPVGRILNYIKIIGTTGMYHKNGYRHTDLNHDIGSAWTTEFMIGLGLIRLKDKKKAKRGEKIKIELTGSGRTIYNEIMNKPTTDFKEGFANDDIEEVREQMDECSSDFFKIFRKIFINSYPFKILEEYLFENGYIYKRGEFIEGFFEAVYSLYDNGSGNYISNSDTTTASNRVPSLTQLCELFGLLEKTQTEYHFREGRIENAVNDLMDYSDEDLQDAVEETEDFIKEEEEDFCQKYGKDGNNIVEAVVRNSTLQRIFKNKLMETQNGKCVMCDINKKELLIGSHIKAASKSDSNEKADHNNGLLLCCNHDKLFDRHLITFNYQNGEIEISKTIDDNLQRILNIDKNYKLPNYLFTIERKEYLKIHNSEFEKKEDDREE